MRDYPLAIFASTFVLLALSVWVGARWLRRAWSPSAAMRNDFSIVLASTLTLLGLVVGFTFSMAISRYDQRKNFEEAEANAIGTEFLRADLLPAADAQKVRALLRDYYELRLLFYTSRDATEVRHINVRTARLQSELWAAVAAPAANRQTPTMALALAGMNDVLNSQGYTQAAWWNRIPRAAWVLMLAIAVCSHLVVGFGVRDAKGERPLLLVLPLVISISFFLIADIDSPRGGVIRVSPDNLNTLKDALRGP